MTISHCKLALALSVCLIGTAAAQEQPASPVREPLQPGPSGVGVSLDVETVTPKMIGGRFVYTAKFVCGRIPHSLFDPQEPPIQFPLVPGTYRTAINIDNPNLGDVTFTKMALTTNPESQPRGKAGAPVRLTRGKTRGWKSTARTSRACSPPAAARTCSITRTSTWSSTALPTSRRSPLPCPRVSNNW
jgi:hypothetical protein